MSTHVLAALALVVLLPAAGRAQAPWADGRLSVHAWVGPNSGGWSKTEESTAPQGNPVRTEFTSGAGAGLRAGVAITQALGVWAAGELNVEQEAPFAGFYGGLSARVALARRVALQGRLGAGRLDDGPYAIAGASAEWFPLRQLSLGVGAEILRPAGSGSRGNGLREVAVEYDGGPERFFVQLGWYSGR